MPIRRRRDEDDFGIDAIRQNFTQPVGQPEPLAGVAQVPEGGTTNVTDVAGATGTGISQRGPRTADMRDANQDGIDDRDQPSTTTSPKTTVPNIGQEEATVREAVMPGGGAKNYDVVAGAEDLGWGDTSRLSGFNTNEWGPGGTEGYHDASVKNTFGKIASRYDSSPDGARQVVNDPDFKRLFPQAELIDHPTDPKIRFFPDDEPVDVLISSGQGGWGWQPEGGGGAAAGAMGGGFNPTSVEALSEGDILEQIKRQLAATAQGREPFLDEALTKEFR